MVVVGIDPGTVKCGIAIYDSERNIVLFNDIISFAKVKSNYLERQFGMIYGIKTIMDKYIDEYDIKYVGIEDQYQRYNIQSTIKLSRMTGALAYMFYVEYDITPCFISPKQATKCLNVDESAFRGKKNKKKLFHQMVVQRVQEEFGIQTRGEDDAFAIAIALATAHVIKE